MKVKKIVLVICSCVFGIVQAQQLEQFTQYMTNSYLVNPALGSVEDMVDIKAGYRNQWTGLQSTSTGSSIAPRTMYLTAHSPIARPHNALHYRGEHKNWHGAGVSIIDDDTGPTSNFRFLASYSYNMGIVRPQGSGIYTKGGVRMSTSLAIGINNYRVNFNDLNYADPNDQVALSGEQNKMSPDGVLGIMIYNEKFNVGLSVNHLFGGKLTPSGISSDGITNDGRLARHAFLHGQIMIPFAYDFSWEPSALVKFVSPAPPAVDLNSKWVYLEKYWLGLSYRHLDAISLAIGAIFDKRFEIAYSYDLTASRINEYSQGSHEIVIGYRILPGYSASNAEDHW